MDYINEALRTESVDGAVTRLHTVEPSISHMLKVAVECETTIDNIKKYVYYGKETPAISPFITMHPYNLYATEENIRLLHAGLGLLTEAAEFLIPVLNSIATGEPVDKVNLKEELGDAQWYQAIACDVLNTDFATIQSVNIAKLKARYPEKFSADKAIHRDLIAEREILEDDSSM